MDPLTIGLLFSGAKMFGDIGKEKRSKQLAAETQRYSPWTGMKAGAVEYADPISTGMQGAGTALAQGQAQDQMASDKAMREAQLAYLKGQVAAPAAQAGPTVSAYRKLSPWAEL